MAIKAKLLARWPSDVTATAPIVATKAAGAVTLSYNSSTLPQVTTPTAAGKVVVREGSVYNEVPALNIAFPTIANNNLIGNVSGSTAAPSAVTGTQANVILPAFTGDTGSGGVKGLVPAPSAGDAAAGRYLKADGTFAVPSGAVSSVSGRTGAVTLDGTDVAFTQAGTGASTRNATLKMRESVSVLDYGAVGNGSTDDTTAFANALATGKTVLVPYSATPYILDGVSVPSNSRLYALGKVTLKRKNSAAAAGILICSGVNNVVIDGFLLDGNLANNTVGADNIRVVASCYNIRLQNNECVNAKYNAGLGNGIGFYDNADAAQETNSYITGNRTTLNGGVGILVERCNAIKIVNNYGGSNTFAGIKLQDPTLPVAGSPVTNHIVIEGNIYTSSGVGISIYGNRSGVSGGNDIITQLNYIHRGITVSNNVCYSNAYYGLAIQGIGITATGNVARANGSNTSNGGVLFNCANSTFSGNTVVDNYFYGIDAGFSSFCDITGNTVYSNGKSVLQGVGINAGATNAVSICENRIGDNGGNSGGSYQILASGVDGASATNWGTFVGYDLTINNNVISLSDANMTAIKAVNNFAGVSVCNNTIHNRFNGTIFQIYLPGASTTMSNNRVLNSSGAWEVAATSAGTMVLPDYGEVVRVTGTATVNYIYTTAFNYGRDKVCTVVMSAAGSGYTSQPTVSLVGGGGTTATGNAALGADGKIYGVYITGYGAGYTPGASFAVGFSGGGGAGAAATAYVGCDNATDRVVILRFDGAAIIKNGTGNIYLGGGDFTGSTTKTLTLRSVSGNWIEVSRA